MYTTPHHTTVVVFVDSVLLYGNENVYQTEKKGMATFYLFKRYRKKQVFSDGGGGASFETLVTIMNIVKHSL